MVQEIIEIGALRLNQYGEVLGEYDQFVKPILHPNLSPFCEELTSITQDDVGRAKTFPDVIEQFQDWALIYEEEYLLCSWGDFDRRMLVQDCRLHRLEEDWVSSHLNLKKQYQEIKRLPKPHGLMKAVLREGHEFTGIHHRAISDAENLAKVFRSHLDEWRF